MKKYQDSWFAINDYVKYLTDNMRSLVKREIRKYTVKDFYANATEIIRNVVLDINTETEATDKSKPFGRFFSTNGMLVNDVDIIQIAIAKNIAGILELFVLAQDLFVIIEIQRKTDAFWTGQRFSSILVFAKAEVTVAGIKDVEGIALFLMDRQLQDLVIEMIRLLNVADRQKDDGGLNRHMSLLSFL